MQFAQVTEQNVHLFFIKQWYISSSKHDTDSHWVDIFDTGLTVCSWLSRFGGPWKSRWFIFGSQRFLLGGRLVQARAADKPKTCTVMFTQMSLMYHPTLFLPLPHHFSLLHCLWSVAMHPCNYHFFLFFLFCFFLPFFSLSSLLPTSPSLCFFGSYKAQLCPRRLNCLPNGWQNGALTWC